MQKTPNKIFFDKLDAWYDPEDTFTHLFGDSLYAFWLDSSRFDPDTARFSYMGDTSGPLSKRIKYSVVDGLLHITKKGGIRRVKKSIFEYLEEQLKMSNTTNVKYQISNEERIRHLAFDIWHLTFLGGFVGYFGYEVQGNTPYKSNFPDAYFFFADRVIVFDHLEKKVYLVCIAESEKEAEEWFEKIKREISNEGRIGNCKLEIRNLKFKKEITFTLARNHRQYIQDIKTCQEYLRKGESYQICLTNSFSANIQVDWLKLYLTLRRMNPAPYGSYMRFGDFAVLSSSPEKFLSITPDGFVETKPIKGTRSRGKTIMEDKQFIEELSTSKKDWSENAMIVDLLRNDLGRVCNFGSIHVKKFLAVETYQTVHQLVSTIQGKLREDMTAIDCVKTCFPGGSMTGVPKKRTMEILSKLEKQPRGVYSGALGFFSLNGAAELSIIIRTIVATKNQLTIGSGGAILIDSDSEKEYDEMLLKARIVIEAITKAIDAKVNTIVGDRENMPIVFLALGSNMGDKKNYIEQAMTLLNKKVTDIVSAPVYESKPVGYVKQDNFYNTVVRGETELTPEELLAFIKETEQKIGRKERFKNGPREIDIDILLYDDLVLNTKNLTIPHPRMIDRDFVLKPFADLSPDTVHPVYLKTMRELLLAIPGRFCTIVG